MGDAIQIVVKFNHVLESFPVEFNKNETRLVSQRSSVYSSLKVTAKGKISGILQLETTGIYDLQTSPLLGRDGDSYIA